jgi:polyhydroxyalkanoate synthase
MNLYHYRPIATRSTAPILIVMATTNRGYILDMVPGQSSSSFCSSGLRRHMLD